MMEAKTLSSRPGSAWCNRRAPEIDTQSDRSSAGQPAALLDRHAACVGAHHLSGRLHLLRPRPTLAQAESHKARRASASRWRPYRLLQVGLQVPAGARIRKPYDLISHEVLCGMSIANEPDGSPEGVGLVMHLNGSRPVIPAYLPVPPVMMWVPQSISGCDLSRSRVSNVENTISPSLSVSWQAPSMYFLPAESMLTAVHFAFILSSIFSPFIFSVGPTASNTVALPTFGTSMLDNG